MNRKPLTITYHGHACFAIDNGSYRLVLDPYRAQQIGYPPLTVTGHVWLSSHDHGDHNEKDAITFLAVDQDPVVRLGPDQPWQDKRGPAFFQVRTILSYHDDAGGKKRGINRIHVIRTAGVTLAHLGDLGHLLSQEQIQAIGPVDLLLLPVGGTYTIDASQALETVRVLKPKNLAPMHYQMGLGNLPISTVDPFLAGIGAEGYAVRQLNQAELVWEDDDQAVCFVFRFGP